MANTFKPSKNCPRLIIFGQSGEISPNLVTLIPSPDWVAYKWDRQKTQSTIYWIYFFLSEASWFSSSFIKKPQRDLANALLVLFLATILFVCTLMKKKLINIRARGQYYTTFWLLSSHKMFFLLMGDRGFNFCLLHTVITIWRGIFCWNGRATNWAKWQGNKILLEWQGKKLVQKRPVGGTKCVK